VSKVAVVPWRSPGYFGRPPIPLTEPLGLKYFLVDVGPVLAALAIVAMGCFPRPTRNAIGAFLFLAVIGAISVALLGKIEVNASAPEGHRFFTLAQLGSVLVLLARMKDLPPRSFARLGAVVTLAVTASCTLLWVNRIVPGMAPSVDPHIHEMDCREETGARPFDRALPTYIPPALMFTFEGCKPLFVPGVLSQLWGVKADGPVQGRQAFVELHQTMVPAGGSLRVLCGSDGTPSDPACAYALRNRRCTKEGTKMLACALDASDRERVLGAW
jgi:hypothetical protein